MAVEISKVYKRFEGASEDTLSDINLTIEDGEFVCIVGPSGCGKSTLLNLIAGFETPNSGEIKNDARVVGGPGIDRVVMFQESALYPWLSVYENVEFGMKLAKVPKSERESRAEHYLRMVHLWKFKDYSIHEISGGMKQRTALARALALDSKVLLMDEPFSALDKQTINRLRTELEYIWESTRKTIIFVTHSVEEAVYFADRVVVLSENPGMIRDIIQVDLPRPRSIENEEFIKVRGRILNQVRKEVDKVAETEYDKE